MFSLKKSQIFGRLFYSSHSNLFVGTFKHIFFRVMGVIATHDSGVKDTLHYISNLTGGHSKLRVDWRDRITSGFVEGAHHIGI